MGAVMAMPDASVARPGGFSVLVVRWQEFSRWWLAELRETLPATWLSRLDGKAPPELLMRRDRDFVVCRLALASGTVEARLSAVCFKKLLHAWLVEHGFGREQIMA